MLKVVLLNVALPNVILLDVVAASLAQMISIFDVDAARFRRQFQRHDEDEQVPTVQKNFLR
jgi:hypothetical protein